MWERWFNASWLTRLSEEGLDNRPEVDQQHLHTFVIYIRYLTPNLPSPSYTDAKIYPPISSLSIT